MNGIQDKINQYLQRLEEGIYSQKYLTLEKEQILSLIENINVISRGKYFSLSNFCKKKFASNKKKSKTYNVEIFQETYEFIKQIEKISFDQYIKQQGKIFLSNYNFRAGNYGYRQSNPFLKDKSPKDQQKILYDWIVNHLHGTKAMAKKYSVKQKQGRPVEYCITSSNKKPLYEKKRFSEKEISNFLTSQNVAQILGLEPKKKRTNHTTLEQRKAYNENPIFKNAVDMLCISVGEEKMKDLEEFCRKTS